MHAHTPPGCEQAYSSLNKWLQIITKEGQVIKRWPSTVMLPTIRYLVLDNRCETCSVWAMLISISYHVVFLEAEKTCHINKNVFTQMFWSCGVFFFNYQIRSWIVWNLAGRLLISALFLCVSFCLFVLLVVCLWCSKRFLPRNVVKQKTEIWQPVAWSKTCTRRKSRWLAYKMVAFPKKKSKWRLLFLFCWLFSWVGWCLARIIYQPWASNFCLNKSVTQQAGQ